MSTFYISADRKNINGVLASDNKPIIFIDSKDSLLVETLEPDWRVGRPPEASSRSGVFMERDEKDSGQALSGPIFIEDAHPDQTLVIHIEEIIPSDWGWSRVGGDANPDHLNRLDLKKEEEYFLLWSIDRTRNLCTSSLGHNVKLRPFLGNIALMPEASAPVSNLIPGPHGGNIDCRELVVGSKLYLPIKHEGALLYLGDGHACQGDGELGGTAIECPMDKVRLSFEIIAEEISHPIANTPAGWISFGFNEDLTEASYIALRNMVRLMQYLYNFNYEEALAMTSITVNMHVTQIVNGIRGAHAILPHESISISK